MIFGLLFISEYLKIRKYVKYGLELPISKCIEQYITTTFLLNSRATYLFLLHFYNYKVSTTFGHFSNLDFRPPKHHLKVNHK